MHPHSLALALAAGILLFILLIAALALWRPPRFVLWRFGIAITLAAPLTFVTPLAANGPGLLKPLAALTYLVSFLAVRRLLKRPAPANSGTDAAMTGLLSDPDARTTSDQITAHELAALDARFAADDPER